MSRWQRVRRSSTAGPVADGSIVLAPGERLLVSVRATDGTWVAGTDRALHLANGVVLGWHQVDQARWTDEDEILEVVTLPEDAAPPQTYRVHITAPGQLPELVRERVTSNIVVSERVMLVGRNGARIVARRLPGDEGIRWSVIYDDGAPRSDPDLQAATREAVARLQMRFGV